MRYGTAADKEACVHWAVPRKTFVENPPASFRVELERAGNRLLLRCTCEKCGASKLVSYSDGSLAEWEREHKCGERPGMPDAP